MSKKSVKTLYVLAGVAGLLALILYTGGFFATGKIEPGLEKASAKKDPAKTGRVKAVLKELPEFYEGVGTLRPRTETTVESQVAARVLEVKARPGDRVKRGQLLVLLDSRQFRAQVEQARQGLLASRAALQRALAEYKRVEKYIKGEAATQRDLEQAREAKLSAQARARQADKKLEEAAIALSYTRITSPEDSRVMKRQIEPGDIAVPGKPLLMLQTGRGLRLEAMVREGLISKVWVGQELEVEIPALNKRLMGRVEEIVPSADPTTRTFLVKVLVPSGPGLYSGMFGRLLVPVGRRPAVMIPIRAIDQVGQLEMVELVTPKGISRIYVTTGRREGDQVEVLSGLKGGETLAVKEAPNA